MALRYDNKATARENGFTLVELMIALVLGLLVVLAATSMLLSSRRTYLTQDEGTRVAENARFATSLTTRIIRLAGYTNFGNNPTNPPPLYDTSFGSPNIGGTNAIVGAPNSSDSLTIRYYGSGTTAVADGTMLDCLGVGVVDAANNPNTNRASNRFYVAMNTSVTPNEPELYCDNNSGSGGQPLVSGVESFQVLYAVPMYGVGADPDVNVPTQLVYKRADQMVATNAWGNDWDLVQYIRIGMLLRSATGARTDLDPNTYKLFGAAYDTANAANDPGTTINVAAMTNLERTRLRRVVTTTILLHNRTSAWPTN